MQSRCPLSGRLLLSRVKLVYSRILLTCLLTTLALAASLPPCPQSLTFLPPPSSCQFRRPPSKISREANYGWQGCWRSLVYPEQRSGVHFLPLVSHGHFVFDDGRGRTDALGPFRPPD